MIRQYGENNCELRFLIPTKAAGAIIGKGGEGVKQIREKFNIKVNLPDSLGPERLLQLLGQRSSILDALEIIFFRAREYFPASEAEYYSLYPPNINKRGSAPNIEEPNSQPHDANSGHSSFSPSNVSSERTLVTETARMCLQPSSTSWQDGERAEVDVRLLIHHKLAGSIIGRGGEKIRDLRQQTGLQMLKIFQLVCPQSTDRVVQMAGPLAQCVACVRCLLPVLEEACQQMRAGALDQPYHVQFANEGQALLYGGWLSRANRCLLLEAGPQALLALNGDLGGPVGVGGGGQQSWSRAGCAPSGGGEVVKPRTTSAVAPLNTKTVQVSVPNMYVGAIMGRGGINIRAVREESGADIRVHDPDKNGGDRIIEITGTQQQIGYAQHLLKSCVLQS